MTIVKRFKCRKCGYLSPAGYKVDECNCPFCKIPMTRDKYRQYQNHCTPIKKHTHEWNFETGYCTICFDNVHTVRELERGTT